MTSGGDIKISMRPVLVKNLRPGTVLPQDLVDKEGNIILHEGVRLSEAYIQGIANQGYAELFLRKVEMPSIEVERNLPVNVQAAATKTLKSAWDEVAANLGELRRETMGAVRKALDSGHVRALMSENGPVGNIPELADTIINQVLSRSLLAGLTTIKSMDMRLHEHSLDVCVIAIMIGKAIGLDKSKLKQLANGCLLHDIGMVFVNAGQSRSTLIRRHTQLGYDLLRKSPDADLLSPFVAYEHHEHQDGSGLPRGLKSSNKVERNRGISGPVPTLLGEIAAVANHYDNLLSGAAGKASVTPDIALREITQKAGKIFNTEVVGAFRSVAPVYPRGTQVRLHGKPYDNYLGIVCQVNPKHLDRPTVVLVRDHAARKITPLKINTPDYPEITLSTAAL
jgi:HD-GYP domain-containing protein (c-di-GMP phosphodiesterase class II)